MPRNNPHPLPLAARGCGVTPEQLTCFVGSERIVAPEDGGVLPRWMEAIFSALLRNAVHVPGYLNVPREQLIDLGRQIAIWAARRPPAYTPGAAGE